MTQPSGPQSQEVQTREQIIATTRRFGETVNSGQLDRPEEIITPNSLDHDPDGYRATFPDLHIKVEPMVAGDQNACFAYTLSGTHQGEFMGFEPTGRSFSASAAQAGSTDGLGLLRQLDFEPK